jgi:hypothetical protein
VKILACALKNKIKNKNFFWGGVNWQAASRGHNPIDATPNQ